MKNTVEWFFSDRLVPFNEYAVRARGNSSVSSVYGTSVLKTRVLYTHRVVMEAVRRFVQHREL